MATANLGITLPTVGGSTDTWGTTLNTGITAIDALFSVSGTDVTMSDIKFNSIGVQETGAGTDAVKIQAPSAVTAYTLTMPGAVPSANQVLSAADGSGTLAWTTPVTGDITGVTAGAGMTGGGTSGDVTLNVIGTADKITVSADAVTIATTYVGQTSVTTLGTVGTGTWSATAIAANKGGTAITSYAVGDILYASGTATLAKLAKGSDTQVLTLASGVPSWATPTVGDLTAIVAGTGLSGTDLSGPIPTLNVDASQTQITALGTITTGVWNGTKVASAYLDDDTAHLSGTQTFTGAKTFSAALVASSTLGVTGTTTLADDLIFSASKVIRRNTSDAADSGFIQLAGGGAASSTRGGFVTFYGNEHASTGKVQITAGNVAGGNVEAWVAGALALTVQQSDGKTYFGATLDTNLYRSAANTLKTDDALIVSSTLAVMGTSTLTGNLAFATDNSLISMNTSDGADNKGLHICGGGAVASVIRGGLISLYGNEDGGTGGLHLSAGNVSGGDIILATGNQVAALTISDAQAVAIPGTLSVTGLTSLSSKYGGDNIFLESYDSHVLAGNDRRFRFGVKTGTTWYGGEIGGGLSAGGGHTAFLAAYNGATPVQILTWDTAGVAVTGAMAVSGATTITNTLSVTATSALTGNVGIGTGAGTPALTVLEATTAQTITAQFNNSSGSTPQGIHVKYTAASPNNGAYPFFVGEDSTAVRVNIWSSGSIVNQNNGYGAISDERLKQNIVDATSQWDDIKALKLRKYRFKTDVTASGEEAVTHLGVIAQELLETSPGLVQYDEEADTYGVQYSILYMKAVGALQEAQHRIEDLTARLDAAGI